MIIAASYRLPNLLSYTGGTGEVVRHLCVERAVVHLRGTEQDLRHLRLPGALFQQSQAGTILREDQLASHRARWYVLLAPLDLIVLVLQLTSPSLPPSSPGEFFAKNALQRFVQDPENPAHLINHDNEYLNYKDDW